MSKTPRPHARTVLVILFEDPDDAIYELDSMVDLVAQGESVFHVYRAETEPLTVAQYQRLVRIASDDG